MSSLSSEKKKKLSSLILLYASFDYNMLNANYIRNTEHFNLINP